METLQNTPEQRTYNSNLRDCFLLETYEKKMAQVALQECIDGEARGELLATIVKHDKEIESILLEQCDEWELQASGIPEIPTTA